jgi:hypothetical protein
MFGHTAEIFIILVILLFFVGGVLGAAWVFGIAIGRGISRGDRSR